MLVASVHGEERSGDGAEVGVRASREGPPLPGADDAGREITAALMNRAPATFAIEASSVAAVTEFATPLRSFLLLSGAAMGGVSAAIAPHFAEQTYPALVDLVGRLNSAGADDLWRPDGARTVALGEAKQMFISADMPVSERSAAPDRLVEVVAAHAIESDWYSSRVAPRLAGSSVVRVFYGVPGVSGSVFESARVEALAEEAITGSQRRFSLDEVLDVTGATAGRALIGGTQ